MRRRLSDADMGQDCDASLVSSQGWSLRRGRQLAAIARDIIEDNMYIGHGLTCLRMSHLCQHQRQSDNQGSQQSPQTLQCLLITSLINVQAAPLTTLPTSTSGPTSPFTPPPPPQSTTILNSKCPRTSTTNRCPPTASTLRKPSPRCTHLTPPRQRCRPRTPPQWPPPRPSPAASPCSRTSSALRLPRKRKTRSRRPRRLF